jgi:signal transduction histidine kinase
LSHVWINIIHNAVQAIQGKGDILIETFMKKEHLGVRITDNGGGISQEVQSKIFDIHFTTKNRGEGTGLGLYIAHKIVKKHEGTIRVVSTPGKTTFEVLLPLASPF